MNWMQVAAGGLTGFVVGLTGVGGGALMTPILLLVFGIPPMAAVGTDLWFAALTKVVAAHQHHQNNLIDWEIVKRLWTGSLPGAAATMAILHLGSFRIHEFHVLKLAIAAAVVLTALGLIFQKLLLRLGSSDEPTRSERSTRSEVLLTVGAGAILGILVTLTSIGAGALGTVLLVYLYPRRLSSPTRLIATDIAHAIPLAVFAGMAHLVMGHVDFLLLGTMLLGSLPGVMLGVKLSAKLPQVLLRFILAGTLLFIGIRLWASA